jgi:hypothetical protein
MRVRAAPYLLQRLRRWWALQILQTRAEQLAGLIRQIEANMATDADEHASALFELRAVNARLAAARQHSRQPQQRRGTAW